LRQRQRIDRDRGLSVISRLSALATKASPPNRLCKQKLPDRRPQHRRPVLSMQGQPHHTLARRAADLGAEILPLGLGSAGFSRTCGEFMFCEPSALNRGLAVAAGCISAAAASANDVQCWAAPSAALRSPEPRAQWEPVDLAENLLRLSPHTTPRWRKRGATTREMGGWAKGSKVQRAAWRQTRAMRCRRGSHLANFSTVTFKSGRFDF